MQKRFLVSSMTMLLLTAAHCGFAEKSVHRSVTTKDGDSVSINVQAGKTTPDSVTVTRQATITTAQGTKVQTDKTATTEQHVRESSKYIDVQKEGGQVALTRDTDITSSKGTTTIERNNTLDLDTQAARDSGKASSYQGNKTVTIEPDGEKVTPYAPPVVLPPTK